MVGIGFAAGLAEGLNHTADLLAKSNEQKRQIEAQMQLHAQDLKMRQLQINTPDRIAAGLPILDFDESTGVPKPIVRNPTPEMQKAAQQHLLEQARLELERQKPLQDQQADALAKALGSFTKEVDVPLPLSILEGGPLETAPVETPVFNQEQAKSIAGGLVQGGSGASAISNSVSSLVSSESKLKKQELKLISEQVQKQKAHEYKMTEEAAKQEKLKEREQSLEQSKQKNRMELRSALNAEMEKIQTLKNSGALKDADLLRAAVSIYRADKSGDQLAALLGMKPGESDMNNELNTVFLTYKMLKDMTQQEAGAGPAPIHGVVPTPEKKQEAPADWAKKIADELKKNQKKD